MESVPVISPGQPETCELNTCGHFFHLTVDALWPHLWCPYPNEMHVVLAQPVSGLPRLQSFHMINGLINLQSRKRKEKKPGGDRREGGGLDQLTN